MTQDGSACLVKKNLVILQILAKAQIAGSLTRRFVTSVQAGKPLILLTVFPKD